MAFEGLSEKLNNAFKKLRSKGRLTEEQVAAVKERFHVERDLQKAVADVDMVIEAIVEDKEIKRIEKEEGRHICVIGALCGTDIEPQDVADQARRLEEYGVILQPSNAKAALLAGLIVS